MLVRRCTAQLAKDGCSASVGVEACDTCAGAHQSDLKAAGCTPSLVRDFCAGGEYSKELALCVVWFHLPFCVV